MSLIKRYTDMIKEDITAHICVHLFLYSLYAIQSWLGNLGCPGLPMRPFCDCTQRWAMMTDDDLRDDTPILHAGHSTPFFPR